MPLRINTNLPALNAKRILSFTGMDLAKRIERLSSGLKVNQETSAFSRAQILSQFGLAVFSQANIQAASVLSLL